MEGGGGRSHACHIRGLGRFMFYFIFVYFVAFLESFSLIYSIPTKSNKIKSKSKNNNYFKQKLSIRVLYK